MWALATDPPPELRAMVIQVGSDDFHGFFWLDVCLDPTLAAYRRLRDAGREVRLTPLDNVPLGMSFAAVAPSS